MRNIFTLLLIAFFAINLNAQNQAITSKNDTANYPYWFEMMQDPNADFKATQSAYNKYFENRTFTKGDGHKVFKRWEYFTQSRLTEDGKRQAPDLVMNEYKSMLKNNAMFSPGGQWTELGPISMPSNSTGQPNGLGRINALAFHPTNNSIIWAGAPSGGLWKTTDGGSTWSSNTDNLPTLGISAILIDPSNTNTMYIGTGDRDGGDAPGLGVMKSIDGGQSWTSANSTMGNVTVNMMVMNPNNSSRILAATSDGIYRSTDGASTWTKVSTTDNIKDIKIKPSTPGTMYAASNGTFYRSTNQGASWSVVNSGLPSTGRFVIGVSSNNINVVYIVAGGSGGFIGIYKSTNSGQSFTSQSTSPNILGYSTTGTDNASQAWYDLCIAVDPTNANTVYVGGINIWKSTNGGSSWSLNTHWVGGGGVPAVHADIHTLDWAPNGDLFNGNDGGVYKTSNGGTSWTEISSGLAIAQVYKIGQSAGSNDLTINGYQDNGTAIYNNANSTWTTVIGGDGMECIIDPNNSNYKYGSLYYGDIRRSVNNGSFQQIAGDGVNGINENGGWVTPFTLFSLNPTIMFIGYDNVWKSTNIKSSSTNNISWTKISNFGSAPLQVIEHCTFDYNLLFVSRNNTIWRCDDHNAASPTWTSLSAPAYVKDIETYKYGYNDVYIAAGNKVYYSSNKGNSWTDISYNLPNVSMNTLVIDTTNSGFNHSGIYVGSDLGVYYLGPAMSSWVNFSSGLPLTAEITELEIYYGTINKIRASTYGRGLWTSDLYSPANIAPTVDFAATATNACPGETLGFTDYSTDNPSSWQWVISPSSYTFVGGTSASSQNPQIQFNASAYYTVKLIASNAFGTDSLTKTNYINVAIPKTFAYLEDFQNFPIGNSPNLPFGWTKDDSGVFTWQGRTGATSSVNTGPSNDNTYGNSTGVYYYTEASLPSQAGDIARLVSPCIDIPNNSLSSLSFYYHMYGSAIIGLHIDVFHNGSWSPLDSIIGQQHFSSTANWTQKTISLAAYTNSTIKIRFWAERSASSTHYYGDIAIDDIEFSIPGYPVAGFIASLNQACGAEIINLADQTSNNPTSWNWQISPNTFTFVNNTNSNSQNPSLMFSAPGDYDVKLVTNNSVGSDSILKSDFISISNGNPLPTSENMESFTIGNPLFGNGWTQENNGDYIWYTNSGGTPSNNTGPNVDHTLGTSSGKYVYAEASSPAVQNDVSSFISPCIDLSNINNAYLKFWYHIYGANVGSLNIDLLYNGSWINIYTLTGQQQTTQNAPWLQASINLNSYLGNSTKVRFRAIRGANWDADIALDDIEIVTLSPPANDDACGATLLNAGSFCNFTTSTNDLASTSTGMQSPTCGNFNGSDVWFKTVVPTSGYLTIKSETVTGSFLDGAMAVYSGSCGNLTMLNCDDDSGIGVMPELNLNGLNPGDSLFIRFWQNGGTQTGQFKICVFEPDYIDISPSNVNVSGSLGSTNYSISSSSSWSITDNASWLVVNPSSGNGNATVTASYSANSTATRTATITVNSSGLNPVTATLTQYSSTFADFTIGNQYVCKSDNITFTNASVNASSYKWFVDNVQVSTNTNLTHSFSNSGSYEVSLVAIGSSINDTTKKTVFVFDLPYANAGSDTAVCENEKVYFNAADSYGYDFCVGGNCDIPAAYCASAGANDNFEYIHQISLNSSQNTSENEGAGYQDFSSDVFTVLTKDSSYTINVVGKVIGATAYTEYVDVYIDWNRNGLFDEPAVSLGSANYTGTHTFSGTVTVPNNAQLGKTKMRIILKYNSAPTGGCDNNYGYGESEDYMIEINEIGSVNYSWSGSGFSSNNQNDSILSINLSQSGLFTLSLTDGLSCVNTDTKNVTVNQLPQITFNSIPDICVNDSPIALSQASPTGGTYSGTGVSSGNFDPAVAGVGTHTITYTYSDANSCANSATQTITVNTLPNPSFGVLPNNLCENTSNLTNLSATPSGGIFSGTGVVNNNQFDAVLAGTGSHQITYTYTDANSCTNSTNAQITVNPIAHVSAGNDTTINYGTSIYLNGSAQNILGFNFNWSPASLVQAIHALAPPTVNLTQSQVFTLSAVSQTTGCNDSDDVLVTVVGGPISVNVSASQTSICQGESVQLSSLVSGGVVGANIVYTWTSSPSGFSSSAVNPTVNPTVSTTYYCNVTDGTTFDQDTITIIVNPLPNVTFSLPFANLCETDSTFYDMDNYVSPAGGVFSGNGISSNILFAGQLGVGNNSITYTYTDLNGCTDSVQQSVNIIPKPQLSISSIPNYCVNDGIDTLNFVSPAGGIYYGVGVINNTLFDPSITGSGVHSIGYYYEDANQCGNTIDTTIEVFSNPTASAGSNQSVAIGNSVNLSGSGSGGSGNYSFHWEPSALINNPNSNNTSTINLNTSTLFTLEVSDNNSSCSDIDTTLITVTGGALSVSAFANSNIICEGGSANIFAVGSGGSGNYTYLWKSIPTGFTANTQNVNVNPTQTTDYIIEVNDSGSIVTDTVKITVYPIPQIDLGSDTALCNNSIYILDAGSGYTSYFWSNGSTNQTVNIDPQQIGVGIHQFFVNVTNSFACSASDTVNISIGQKPYINIGLDDTICHFSTKYLDAGFGFDNYLWNTGETSQIIQVGLPLNNANMGDNIYKVEVWNQTTCVASDSINIFVEFCESIENFDDNRSIEIYPNPTSDKLNLNFVGYQNQDIIIELLDNTGRKVYIADESIKVNNSLKTISTEKFAKGIYYINIIAESGVYREKIIVQ